MAEPERRDDILAAGGDPGPVERLADENGVIPSTVEPDPLAVFDQRIRVEDVPREVRVLVAEQVDDPGEGFFGPDSMIWEIGKENLLHLAGPTALLLQMSHPLVAAALEAHGQLHTDLGERFRHTFQILDTIFFGDAQSAVRAAVILRRMHEGVAGSLGKSVGPYDDGDTYYANRPHLLLWIAGTLIDASITAYETYVGPLSAAEKEQHYQEYRVFNRLVGVPPEDNPETYAAFEAFYERTLETEVAIGDSGLVVSEGFLAQFGPARPLAELLGAAHMPDPAREAFGLSWGPRRQRAFDAIARTIRAVPLDWVPDRIRYRNKYRLFDRV
jgi:uncharacterized protein (DUF2236 family)